MDLDAIDVVEIESENSGDEKNVDSKSILNDQSDKDLEDNEGEKNEEIKTAVKYQWERLFLSYF